MKIFIDGEARSFNNDAKVIILAPGDCELHVTLTHEGIIFDHVNKDGDVINSDCELYPVFNSPE